MKKIILIISFSAMFMLKVFAYDYAGYVIPNFPEEIYNNRPYYQIFYNEHLREFELITSSKPLEYYYYVGWGGRVQQGYRIRSGDEFIINRYVFTPELLFNRWQEKEMGVSNWLHSPPAGEFLHGNHAVFDYQATSHKYSANSVGLYNDKVIEIYKDIGVLGKPSEPGGGDNGDGGGGSNGGDDSDSGKGILELLLTAFLELPMKLLKGLADLLVDLFIPSEGFFENLINTIMGDLGARLGIGGYVQFIENLGNLTIVADTPTDITGIFMGEYRKFVDWSFFVENRNFTDNVIRATTFLSLIFYNIGKIMAIFTNRESRMLFDSGSSPLSLGNDIMMPTPISHNSHKSLPWR